MSNSTPPTHHANPFFIGMCLILLFITIMLIINCIIFGQIKSSTLEIDESKKGVVTFLFIFNPIMTIIVGLLFVWSAFKLFAPQHYDSTVKTATQYQNIAVNSYNQPFQAYVSVPV